MPQNWNLSAHYCPFSSCCVAVGKASCALNLFNVSGWNIYAQPVTINPYFGVLLLALITFSNTQALLCVYPLTHITAISNLSTNPNKRLRFIIHSTGLMASCADYQVIVNISSTKYQRHCQFTIQYLCLGLG